MSSEMQNIEKEKKGDGGKKLLIGICGVVVIAAVGVGAFAFGKSKSSQPVEAEEQKEVKKVITPDTAEEVVDEILAEDTSNIPSSYTVTQNGTWTFQNGSAATEDAYVENDKENETPIYFDLIVDNTGQKIYSSPILELGAVLEGFTLDTPLEQGEYECTVEYHLVDENQKTLTTTNIGVKVIVLE